jgi:hypothetical protein
MRKLTALLMIFSVAFLSCKKIISVGTKDSDPKIVIEANITDQNVEQIIRISKTVNLDNTNKFPAVSKAEVKVTDNLGNTYVFKEAIPGFYIHKMRGVIGRTYTLNVSAEGQEYTAISTMPKRVKLDSLSLIKTSFFNKENLTVGVYFNDPLADVNFYKLFLYINGKQIKNIYVYNDRLTNGKLMHLQLFYNSDEIDELKKGDTVDVEMFNIDGNMYNYWFSLSSQLDNGPNQSTTPSNPPSNISNGALGYFSASVLQVKSVVVK